ncbi:oxidoreductase [Synergistales bacterium]|nr:oxidoreductase [Synergistales bacterium]
MGRLEEKVCVVTGSNGGIGAAVAKGFLREGANVVLTEFRTKGAAEHAKETGVSEDKWMVQPLDASKRDSVDALIAATLERFGRLDVFMAHAGSNNRYAHFLDATEEDFDYLMANNCRSIFSCSQAAAKAMLSTGGGSIIHTASMLSFIARRNSVVYGATKGCVMAMTRNMAYDLAKYNIRVNALAPGTVKTNQNKSRLEDPVYLERNLNDIPLGHIGLPEDMVGAAIFLASDESSFVTGTSILLDGGLSTMR